jgi:hypothetical protein
VEADLELVEARWRLGLIAPSDLRDVASDLLDNEIGSESLVGIYALPSDAVAWRGAELFDQALQELGRGEVTEEEAAHVVAGDIAADLLSDHLLQRKRPRWRPPLVRSRSRGDP